MDVFESGFGNGCRRTMPWNTFIWLLLLFSGAAESTVTINQSPQRVTVTEGGTVQLNCTCSRNTNHSGDKIIGAIKWYKDVENRSVCNSSGEYSGRVVERSSFGILNSSIQITNLKMNDTGKYYCQLQMFRKENYSGHGTEVIVIQRNENGMGRVSIDRNIYFLGFSLLVVLLALPLIVVIYKQRRCRSPDKGSRTQVVTKVEDKSENIVSAQVNIKEPSRNQPLDHVPCESVKPPVRNKELGPLWQAGRDEESFVYSEVKRPDRTKDRAQIKPKEAPGRKEEQVVYAAVNVRRL